MSVSTLDDVFAGLRLHGEHAALRQQLDWLDAMARRLVDAGSRFPQHSAYHADAIADLRGELARLEAGPVGAFLRRALARRLDTVGRTATREAAEAMLINSSFVLSTLVDMLQNPEQPFEIVALLFEGQAMFDDWYAQLLAMSGLSDPD